MSYNADMNRYKLCIFDMDGLLIDTEIIYLKTALQCSQLYGYNVPEELIRSTMGNNSQETKNRYMRYLGDAFPYEEFMQKRSALEREYIENNSVQKKKGCDELLDFLDEKGIRKAIATSTKRRTADRFLAITGLTGRFDHIVYGDDLKESKPRPEIYLKAAAAFPYKKEEILAFEDSGNGILSAVAAGLKVVHIPDLANVPEEIKEKSLAVFDDLSQAVKLFED